MKGLMEELCKPDSQAASFLRENFVILVVPMLNPDGVSIGNTRTSLSGYDLNKCWKNPDRFIQPEIYYTKKLLLSLAKHNKIAFFTDFHMSSMKNGCFTYSCNVPGSAKVSREFPAMLYELLNHFQID